MPPSPLTLLRKTQPGSLTLDEVARRMKRAGVARYFTGVSKFERGEITTPDDAFLRAYAAALGVAVGVVVREFARTVRWRSRYVRPASPRAAGEKSPLTRARRDGLIGPGRQGEGGRCKGRECDVARSASVDS